MWIKTTPAVPAHHCARIVEVTGESKAKRPVRDRSGIRYPD
jgi:hypothetical protein